MIISLLVLSNGFMLYYFVFYKNKVKENTEKSELYVCPMHPQIQQDHPGTCPVSLVFGSTYLDESPGASPVIFPAFFLAFVFGCSPFLDMFQAIFFEVGIKFVWFEFDIGIISCNCNGMGPGFGKRD